MNLHLNMNLNLWGIATLHPCRGFKFKFMSALARGSETERLDDAIDVREIIEDEMRAGGLQGGATVAASGYADAARVDGEGAGDIVRGIADDEDVLRAECDAVCLLGAAAGKGTELVALLGIVGKCAE